MCSRREITPSPSWQESPWPGKWINWNFPQLYPQNAGFALRFCAGAVRGGMGWDNKTPRTPGLLQSPKKAIRTPSFNPSANPSPLPWVKSHGILSLQLPAQGTMGLGLHYLWWQNPQNSMEKFFQRQGGAGGLGLQWWQDQLFWIPWKKPSMGRVVLPWHRQFLCWSLHSRVIPNPWSDLGPAMAGAASTAQGAPAWPWTLPRMGAGQIFQQFLPHFGIIEPSSTTGTRKQKLRGIKHSCDFDLFQNLYLRMHFFAVWFLFISKSKSGSKAFLCCVILF